MTRRNCWVFGAALLAGVPVIPLRVSGSPVACAAAPGEVHIAVVIDGPADSPSTSCVGVAADATGLDVLTARARALHVAPPRFAPSGLLCAIDGVPATGCGEQTTKGYRYWSYWRSGPTGWQYASIGPGSTQVVSSTAEGWRFVEGKADGSDPAPRATADATALCASAPARRVGSDPAPRRGPIGTIAGGVGVVVLAGQGVRMARRRAATRA